MVLVVVSETDPSRLIAYATIVAPFKTVGAFQRRVALPDDTVAKSPVGLAGTPTGFSATAAGAPRPISLMFARTQIGRAHV